VSLAASIVIGIVAAIHLYILWFEMFAWTTRGRKVFRHFPKELFEPTKPMAANQGLYNGFLAAGLIWSFFIENPDWQVNVALFFLGCVAVAGIFGALTASKKIFFVQAMPALIGIALLVFF
jgi:putative membrane protein